MNSPVNFLKLSRMLWAAPCTVLGLMLCAFASLFGARVRWVDGAWECCLPSASVATKWLTCRQRYVAITLGHAIFALSEDDLRCWHAHERVHVRQFEMLGALMLIAYPAASVWAWLRGQDAYMGNFFERQAYQIEQNLKQNCYQ